MSLSAGNALPSAVEPVRMSCRLALQLRFLRSSESIGHHDSEIVDDGYFDRDDAGALGVIAAGCQSADGAIVYPGAGGGFCGLISGRTTRRRAAQDRLDACGKRRAIPVPGASRPFWVEDGGTLTRCATSCVNMRWRPWPIRMRFLFWMRPGFSSRATRPAESLVNIRGRRARSQIARSACSCLLY